MASSLTLPRCLASETLLASHQKDVLTHDLHVYCLLTTLMPSRRSFGASRGSLLQAAIATDLVLVELAPGDTIV